MTTSRPGVLLQRERLVDGPVLDLLERGAGKLPGVEALSGVEQLGGPEEASNDVGAGVQHEDSVVGARPLAFPGALGRAFMRDILVLCPQERDLKAIRAAGLEERYRLRFAGSDLDQLESFDPEGFLDECETIPADGVVGTKDQSALLAALLAERRGLPGPSPEALVRLAAQADRPLGAAARRAGGDAPLRACSTVASPFDVPFFVKPVVGRLSQNVFRIDDPRELLDLHEIDRYTTRYAEIAALAGADPAHAHGFLVEELLTGDEVTLEGYVHDGRVTVIGVTDSLKYAGTLSFESFVYPSALPQERLDELADVTARVVPRLGFDGGFFNVEFFVPEEGPAQIIEVNGRIASQFAPLVQGVHGRSTLRRSLPARARRGPGLAAPARRRGWG